MSVSEGQPALTPEQEKWLGMLREWKRQAPDRRFDDGVELALALDAELAREREARQLWECPDCGFSFDAGHEDEDGGHSCPACAELRLEGRVRELQEKLRRCAYIASHLLDHVQEFTGVDDGQGHREDDYIRESLAAEIREFEALVGLPE